MRPDIMREKRKHKRINLIFYLEILDNETGKPLGNLADISNGGLMMVGDEQMETGKEFLLSLCLPEATYGQKIINFKAHPRCSKVDVNPTFYASGYEFIEIGPVETKTIESLIDNFSFNGS